MAGNEGCGMSGRGEDAVCWSEPGDGVVFPVKEELEGGEAYEEEEKPKKLRQYGSEGVRRASLSVGWR